jgi:uncharacterized membrane protein (UPF0182 family)
MAKSQQSGSPISLRARILIAIGLVAVFLLAVSGSLASFYTDMQWFGDMSQPAVFWTRVWSELAVGAAFTVLSFAIIYANLMVARGLRPRVAVTAVPMGGAVTPQQQLEETLRRVRLAVDPWSGLLILIIAAVIALNIGGGMASGWETFRLAMTGKTFGILDPQFKLDAGFFVFTLPALRIVADWLFGILVLTLVLVLGAHLYEGGIRPAERFAGFDPHVKAHISVLLGLIVASKAFDYWLSIYELDFSPRGQVLGASYTDVHAQIPAYWILIVIALVVGVLLMLNIRFKGWKLPLYGLGVWIGASILIGGVYPALIQGLQVAPNELAFEKPYIQRNIAATRAAFDIASVDATGFAANTDLTAADIAEATSTVKNIRLFDPNVVVDSYKQLQEIRFYYDFKDVDIDRYVIDGVQRQVLVSAREMNVTQLDATAKTWINRHLVYTHGYGVVMSPVNEVSPEGLPNFFLKDLPTKSSTDLKVTVPGIYYGEETTDYAIVDTTQKEFDYPVGGQNATTEYSGNNGIPIGTLADRLAFSIVTGDVEILFSSAITPTSRMLYRRTITDRVKTLAPWLTLDSDPYPIIVGGHVLWVLDGFTTSSDYPYSQRETAESVNYIRNSVKITVDAYTGKTTFYAFDEKDPVLAAYRAIYPTLFTDASQMPAGVRAHLRYPEDLFKVQADVYKTYHMLDPQVFYNKEDQWAIPGEGTDAAMDPFYVLMKLPGQSTEHFLLMEPFTPRSKDNMIGWMAASSDPSDYGQRTVYNFPKQRLIMGPQQIRARLNQEPSISSQITLLNQQGSSVIFGNLLVIPIRDAIVYVEPLYLKAAQSPMPELKRVIVAYADKIAMDADLSSALADVFGAGTTGSTGTTASVSTTIAPFAGANDIASARDLYAKAIAAQQAGNWAAYGTYIKQLGAVLDRLKSAASIATTATK